MHANDRTMQVPDKTFKDREKEKSNPITVL